MWENKSDGSLHLPPLFDTSSPKLSSLSQCLEWTLQAVRVEYTARVRPPPCCREEHTTDTLHSVLSFPLYRLSPPSPSLPFHISDLASFFTPPTSALSSRPHPAPPPAENTYLCISGPTQQAAAPTHHNESP